MKKTHIKGKSKKPVADLVQGILEQVQRAKTDGPSSGLYGREAQMSTALTQAGTLLAKLDRSAPPRRSSVLHALIGGAQDHEAKPRRKRGWFFGGKTEPVMPDAKRIEQLLQRAQRQGQHLVLDRPISVASLAANDIDCHLPEGAEDPVCMPR